MLKLILGRHGSAFDAYEKIDEETDVFRQTSASPLSKLGISQAQLLGKQLSIYRPEVLLTSPLERAKETARWVAEFHFLFPNIIDDFQEIRRGPIDKGISIYDPLNLEYKRWRGKTIRDADLSSRFTPDGESHGEFLARIAKKKHWLRQEFDGQIVVVVGHSQAHAMFISSALLGDKPNPKSLFESFNRHFMSHAAYSILTWDHRKGWQMKPEDFNITKHLK